MKTEIQYLKVWRLCGAENAQLYRKRQEINEHIFGTIKRKWGYNYTDINILGVPELIAKLQKWNSPYKAKVLYLLKTTYLKLKSDFVFCLTPFAA